jgi:hypothetical protein
VINVAPFLNVCYTSIASQKKILNPCSGAELSKACILFLRIGAMLSSTMQSVAMFFAGQA